MKLEKVPEELEISQEHASQMGNGRKMYLTDWNLENHRTPGVNVVETPETNFSALYDE